MFMFVVTAETGEYADRATYNLFVCKTKRAANKCIRAIDNWFGLQGIVAQSVGTSRLYQLKKDSVAARDKLAREFREQFGVVTSIDYTGVSFDVETVPVYEP